MIRLQCHFRVVLRPDASSLDREHEGGREEVRAGMCEVSTLTTTQTMEVVKKRKGLRILSMSIETHATSSRAFFDRPRRDAQSAHLREPRTMSACVVRVKKMLHEWILERIEIANNVQPARTASEESPKKSSVDVSDKCSHYRQQAARNDHQQSLEDGCSPFLVQCEL